MRPALLTLLFLLTGGCQSLTDVVVRIDSADLTGADISSVSVKVSDVEVGSDGGTQEYASPALAVCAAGQSHDCYSFPITVTLAPGAHDADTKVRVEVDAVGSDGKPFSSDAALFSFTPHTGKALDFFLSKNCSGTDCASSNLACDNFGSCSTVIAQSAGKPPDLATPQPTGVVTRISATAGLYSTATFNITPPPTQAGDVILIAFENDTAADTTQPLPAGWTLFGQINATTAVVYRFADGTEAASAALFAFTAPKSVNSAGNYFVAVYRGARTLSPVVTKLSPPYAADAASCPPGGVVVTLIDQLDVRCDVPDMGGYTVINTGACTLVEEQSQGGTSIAALPLPCISTQGNLTAGIYEMVLAP